MGFHKSEIKTNIKPTRKNLLLRDMCFIVVLDYLGIAIDYFKVIIELAPFIYQDSGV